MTARTATKSGNWNDVTVWDGGATLPGAGDTADSNGYDVTIDMDITVTALIGTNAAAGGFLVTAAPRTITAGITATVRTVLTVSHATGTLTITGAITGGGTSGAKGVYHTNVGPIAITGAVTGGSASNCIGVHNSSTATITVAGDVTGGATNGVQNSAGGTVTITGTATGGAGGVGANNQGTGALTVTRAKSGGTAHGVFGVNAAGTTRVSEIEFVVGASYVGPIGGYTKMMPDSAENVVIVIRSDTGAALPLSWDYPAVADVEDGVFYALGTLEGTLAAGACDYPTAANVRAGVAFDIYTGTLDLPAVADVQSGVTFDGATKTGTFVSPAVADVQAAVEYGAAAEFTGTFVVPAEADVQAAVTYGAAAEFTGAFVAPAVGDVQAAVTYGAAAEYTGTFGVPAISDVFLGVGYGAGGVEFTGTLEVGAADWTAGEKAQIRQALGITGTAAATSGTGNLDLALADTAELQGDWVNGGRLDLILDGRASSAELSTDAEIADAVLDEVVSGHVGVGSVGAVLADIPTTAEFELRTLPTADYVVVGDTLAAVTVVGSVAGAVGSVAGNVVGSIGSLATQAKTDVNAEVVDALATDIIADSIPADGTRPSIAQAAYMLVQFMLERSVVGTAVTVKKADGSTALFGLTLNDATSPTTITRSS